MKRDLTCALCSALLILILAGCNMAITALPEDATEGITQGEEQENTESPETPESPDAPAEPVTGAKVSLPIVSNRLLAALGATYESAEPGQLSSQAFLFGTAADITVYQDAVELYTLELTEGDFTANFGDEGPPSLEAYVELDAGSGYTLEILIYNDAVGADPVIEGSTLSSFSVAPGVSTPVTIYGIPIETDVMST